jgi:hypothetical protein
MKRELGRGVRTKLRREREGSRRERKRGKEREKEWERNEARKVEPEKDRENGIEIGNQNCNGKLEREGSR